jgi:hypothetical protein
MAEEAMKKIRNSKREARNKHEFSKFKTTSQIHLYAAEAGDGLACFGSFDHSIFEFLPALGG